MANETIYAFGTQKTLEANGGSIANNALVQADDADYVIASDAANFPHAKFVIRAAFGTAPNENTVLALYARPKNLDGANHAEVPETTRPTRFIGSFVVNNVTTTQTIALDAFDVPRDAAYYVHNVATGQTVSAGWTLKVTPFTYTAAA